MGKVQVVIAGALGVLIGILVAPRKGSETREEIVRRSEPLQQAARKASSKIQDAVKPVTRVVGERVPKIDRVPLIGGDRDGASVEEPVGEAGDQSPAASGDGRDGAAADRRARAGRVGTRS